jgi:FlaG/FlaF family flagellin (archaellin)
MTDGRCFPEPENPARQNRTAGAAGRFYLPSCLITFFSLLPDMNRMRSCPDSALSETIATILIIGLVVVLAAVIAALVLGIPLLPNKPVLAAFKADTVMGSTTKNVPVIRLYQMAGASLTQEYTEGGHVVVNGTRIRVSDPAGKSYKVMTAQSMRGKTMEKGEPFYIFYYNTGVASDAPYMWFTNDPSRVFSSTVQAFTPHGTWKVIVTDEKDTSTVIFQQDVRL